MRLRALTVAALLAAALSARSQAADVKQQFYDYMGTLQWATLPCGAGDGIPVRQNGAVRALHCNTIIPNPTVYDLGRAPYSADTTGRQDATLPIQQAQSDCAAAGGGVIWIGGYRLLHLSDITIAENCPIKGTAAPAPRSPTDWTTAKSALVHPASAHLNMGRGAALDGVYVLASSLPAVPTTAQGGAALVAGMAAAGEGVTATGNGATLRDVQILGFAAPFSSNFKFQLHLDHVSVDGTNGISIVSSHDQTVLNTVEAWPFLTASQSWSAASANITGIADNGSGKVRVGVPTAGFATGNTLFITGAVGFSGVNTKCAATVIDSSHLDCTNISYAPGAIASVTSGSNILKLAAANPSISNGQTVTGADIPGGTVVTWADPTYGYVRLSQAATGTSASESLTFANAPYVSGGTVTLDNNYRSGTGFYLEDNVLLSCFGCFAYQYAINFDLNGERNDNFVASASDFASARQDPTSVGVQMRGASRSNLWAGGYIHGSGTPLIHNSSDPSPNTINIPWIYQGPAATATVMFLQGAAHVSDSYIFMNHSFAAPFFVADAMGSLRLSNNDFRGARGDWNLPGSQVISSNGTRFASTAHSFGTAPFAPMGGSSLTSVAGGVTAFAAYGQSSIAAPVRLPVSGAGMIRDLAASNTIEPGAGKSATITLQRSGVDSVVKCTFGEADRTCTTLGTGLEQSVGDGDTWVLKIEPSAGAAAAIYSFSMKFIPAQ